MNEKYTEIVLRIGNVRLAKDWSYKEIAQDMKRAGYPVSLHTLQRLIRTGGRPNSRTAYKITQYLKTLRPPEEDEEEVAEICLQED
jgi:hypothetical protein